MASIPAPVAESQASISPFGRIIGVLFLPKPTFEDIARKPSWLLPVLDIHDPWASPPPYRMNQRVNWRDYIVQQIEKSPRGANLTAEQKQQQAEVSAKVTVYIVYAVGVVSSGLLCS